MILHWQFSNCLSNSALSKKKCLMTGICTKIGPIKNGSSIHSKDVWLEIYHSGEPENDTSTGILNVCPLTKERKSAEKCSENFAFSMNEVVHILNL